MVSLLKQTKLYRNKRRNEILFDILLLSSTVSNLVCRGEEFVSNADYVTLQHVDLLNKSCRPHNHRISLVPRTRRST